MRDVLFLEGLSQIRDKILVRTQVSRVELRQNRESRYPEHGYRKGLAYNTIEVLPNPERILVQCNWQGRPRVLADCNRPSHRCTPRTQRI